MSDDNAWDYSFTWRIENFLSSACKVADRLESPSFKVKSISGRKWYIRLKPAGESEDQKDYIACHVAQLREKDADKEYAADFKVSIMNANCETLETKICRNRIFGREFESWGWPEFIKKDMVVAEMKECNEDTLIVRCHIKNKEVGKKDKSEARTNIQAEKYSFEWNVKFLPNEIFTTSRHFFCLEGLLYGISLILKDDDIELSVCKMTKSTLSSRPITGKISLLDANGSENFKKTETHTFDLEKDQEIWKLPSLITRKQLQDNIGEYLVDQKLVFLCEFSVCKGDNTLKVSNVNCDCISNIDGLVNLSDDFRCLLANKSNADVKLQTREGVTLQAHRSVLTARSPVFSAMFDREMVENLTGTVDIEDVDVNTLEFFLRFLYTGVVESMDCEVATKLLMVADKYQVPNLKEKCALFLMTSISVENVLQILVHADMVHHEFLKANSLDFVAKHGAAIFSLPECSDWIRKNPELSAEILAIACSETKS